MLQAGYGNLSDDCRETLEVPITAEELRAAVFKGDSKKSPSRDGLGLEFFKVLWDDVVNDMGTVFTQMFRDRKLTENQKQGVIVCIPKRERPNTPEDYKPITLLNTDYKILARLLAARIWPVISELLHPSQHCCMPRNTIFDAVAAVRDAIAYAETTRRPLCVVSWTLNKHLIGSQTHT
jgi:hypothetical protein